MNKHTKASWWIDNRSNGIKTIISEHKEAWKELHKIGRSDAWLAKHLGMDQDEILRLKQITGLAEMYKNGEFGMSWEPGVAG